jgi:hypothetical protein
MKTGEHRGASRLRALRAEKARLRSEARRAVLLIAGATLLALGAIAAVSALAP